MSISPTSEAKELQRLPSLKYYNALKLAIFGGPWLDS